MRSCVFVEHLHGGYPQLAIWYVQLYTRHAHTHLHYIHSTCTKHPHYMYKTLHLHYYNHIACTMRSQCNHMAFAAHLYYVFIPCTCIRLRLLWGMLCMVLFYWVFLTRHRLELWKHWTLSNRHVRYKRFYEYLVIKALVLPRNFIIINVAISSSSIITPYPYRRMPYCSSTQSSELAGVSSLWLHNESGLNVARTWFEYICERSVSTMSVQRQYNVDAL